MFLMFEPAKPSNQNENVWGSAALRHGHPDACQHLSRAIRTSIQTSPTGRIDHFDE
jgi:hypothetical protein